ncbi:MAG: hypothetical protein JXR77_01200 [Lentisphaeria bacterium]|nr:hypothetical protein [Lentisphaeria bacterium]
MRLVGWGLLVASIAARAAEPERGIRVICGIEAVRKATERFAAACDADVAEFLGRDVRPVRPIVRVTIDAAAVPESDPFQLVFQGGESPPRVTHGLIRAFLLRHVTETGRPPPVVTSLDWLAAALTNRILYGNREMYDRFVPDYEPARYLFSRNQFPILERLLCQPVPPDSLVAYRLYAVHCDLLALCLQETYGETILHRLLDTERHGRGGMEALAFLLSDQLIAGDNPQAWYERTAMQVSRRGRRPSDAESIARRLEELVTVPVVMPGDSDFRGKRVPLEELPGALGQDRLRREVLGFLERDFYELLKDAPEGLQGPLADYIAACQEMGKGHTRTARRLLAKARRTFAEALARQRRLEELLDEVEYRYVPAERRLGLYLDVVRERLAEERRFDPQLSAFLDTVSSAPRVP